jgi:uncharacterized protein (DUF1501 family)
MRRSDHSAGDPRDDRVVNGWTRRRFLQAVGAGVLVGPALDAVRSTVPDAWAGPPIGAHDGILVVVTLYGGNDALNTFVPYANGLYHSSRPNLAIAPDQVLHVDAQHGFHPRMPYFKALYDSGNVAVVQGLGYPNPNLSHFSSMAIWMAGRFGATASPTGWLGRWLDSQPPAAAASAAVSVGTSVPLHMVGATRRAVAISEHGDMFGAGRTAHDLRMHAGLMTIGTASGGRGQLHDMFASTMRRQLEVASEASPVFASPVAGDGLVGKMALTARLVNANIGMRVFDVGQEGYDHHELLPSRHADLLAELDSALQAFYATLAPELIERVTVMTVSEFGRMSLSNASHGADHGTASTHFVIGRNVRGGQYGAPPSLARLDRARRLHASLDFRSLYGSVVEGWLGGGGATVVGGPFEDLGLFAGAPGSWPPVPGRPVVSPAATSPSVLVAPSGFVPMSPVRVFDMRDGTGGRARPLGAGESWDFVFGPDLGVAPNATAVAVNVTSVDATRASFVTAWPSGEVRPFTANLNPVPRRAVPNLVVATLGAGGAVSFFNYDGTVHLVGDLVGFFGPTSTVGLAPLAPSRLLDTRDGTGGIGAAVGAGESIDVQIAGRGGVPEDAAAVALNITVTEPTAPSFLTVWPEGEPRPLAASLNMVAGQTVPNMVMARLANGRVSIYNLAGSTHVVVDVLGAFGEGFAGRYVPITPARLLDSRDGLGAARARIGQTPISLPILGRSGIPAAGVGAVLLNVTAVSPTADTYVTVYPTGGDRPLAANLNAVAGQIVPNMVLGRLGPDGAVAMFNYAGEIDLVADAMGYFTR